MWVVSSFSCEIAFEIAPDTPSPFSSSLTHRCHRLTGDLFDRLDEQPDYHYTEAQCARLVKMMVSSVRYLHSKGTLVMRSSRSIRLAIRNRQSRTIRDTRPHPSFVSHRNHSSRFEIREFSVH